MYRRPTSPDEFASPPGCAAVADRSSSAAEFTAPHEAITSDAPIRSVSPFRSTSTASTFRPPASASKRTARLFVHKVTFEWATASSIQQDCASLFIRSLQGNELHVAQS